jgi:Helix-turn-helix domain
MSWKATAYVKPLKAAPDGTPLTRSEKLLMLILADYHNDEQRAAWPSGQTLARDALLSLRYVRKLVLSLKRKGLVCTSRRLSREGDLDSTLYHFHALDCGDDHEGGSELSSLPPQGGSVPARTLGSEPISSPRSELEDTTVVNGRGRGINNKPPAEPPAEPQSEPPHTHAPPPLLALAESAEGGVCAKSKYTFEQRLSYARNRPHVKNPEGFAASRRASEGEFDEAISAWLAEQERPGAARQRDVSGCPDCFGTGMWYPEGPGRGVARCRHERLSEQGASVEPVSVPP